MQSQKVTKKLWQVADLVAATGATPEQIRYWLEQNVIAGYHAGEDWYVQAAEARRFLREYQAQIREAG